VKTTTRESKFDALPFDQQIVRLKETVAYLTRRCETAESALVIADTTAANLHDVIRELQRRVAWAEFLEKWVDYHHGSGESDRAFEEFRSQPLAVDAGDCEAQP
jgi:hypothetical protein